MTSPAREDGARQRRRDVRADLRSDRRRADTADRRRGQHDALLGRRVLRPARRRPAVRAALRPPRHRPLHHLAAGRAGLHPRGHARRRARGCWTRSGSTGPIWSGCRWAAGWPSSPRSSTRNGSPRWSSSRPARPGRPAIPTCRGCPSRCRPSSRAVPEPDWTDRDAVMDYLVEQERLCAARSVPFDQAGMRAAMDRVLDRGRELRSMLNHFMVIGGDAPRHRLAEITAPTLVLHGDEDPLLPPPHGAALAAEIPGARLVGCRAELGTNGPAGPGPRALPDRSWRTPVGLATRASRPRGPSTSRGYAILPGVWPAWWLLVAARPAGRRSGPAPRSARAPRRSSHTSASRNSRYIPCTPSQRTGSGSQRGLR